MVVEMLAQVALVKVLRRTPQHSFRAPLHTTVGDVNINQIASFLYVDAPGRKDSDLRSKAQPGRVVNIVWRV